MQRWGLWWSGVGGDQQWPHCSRWCIRAAKADTLYTLHCNMVQHLGSKRLHRRASIVLSAESCRSRDMCMIKDLYMRCMNRFRIWRKRILWHSWNWFLSVCRHISGNVTQRSFHQLGYFDPEKMCVLCSLAQYPDEGNCNVHTCICERATSPVKSWTFLTI